MSSAALKPVELWIRRRLLGSQSAFSGELVTQPRDALGLGNSPRILAVRLERIGDVLVSIPVLRSIRQRYPGATLDFLLSEANAGVTPAIRPWVDRVWRYDKHPVAACALAARLRRRHYDVMLDLAHGPSATSQVLARYLGARSVVGILHERPGHLTHAVPLRDRHEVPIVERLAELLKAFDIDPAAVDLRLEYPVTPDERQRAARFLPSEGPPLRLLVNLSGRGSDKYWGRDNFIAAVRWMRQRDPRFGIILGGEPQYAGEVAAVAAATSTIALPPMADFHEYAVLVSGCDLVLTPDTSVVHVAAAARIPQVVLYRADPEMMPWLPYRTPHRAIVHDGPLWEVPLAGVTAALDDLVHECFGPHGVSRSAAPASSGGL